MYTTQWYLEQWGLWTHSGTGIPLLNNPKERRSQVIEISDDEALIIDRAVASVAQQSIWKSKVINMYFRWNKTCLEIAKEFGYKSSETGYRRVQESIAAVEEELLSQEESLAPEKSKICLQVA